MPTVRLGNVVPHQGRLDPAGELIRDDQGRPVFDRIELDAPAETLCHLPDSDNLLEQLRAVTDLWARHSAEPPSWVWSDDDVLQNVVALHFGCPGGLPDDVEATHYTHSGPPTAAGEEG